MNYINRGSLLFLLAAITLGGSFFVPQKSLARTAISVGSPFQYYFSVPGTLVEAGNPSESTSGYWWVNSGAALVLADGNGQTLQGSLPSWNYWRNLYAKNNPLDTENGYKPQNIFRLVSRSAWENPSQKLDFKINKTNLTNTPNREGYSGILLMSRYQDGNNLYYAGLRHDGRAVIKKKKNGAYTTLASAKVFSGTYDKWSSPNLIPEDKWMNLESSTKDLSDGSVEVTLSLDGRQILKAIDRSNVVKGSAYVGLRTDFMDVVFDNYRISEL